MIRTLLLCCLMAVFSLALAQTLTGQDTNQLDQQGRKQGYWKQYDAEGKIKYEGEFTDDKPFGKFTYYYPNGKVKAISIMIDGGNRSRTRLFHNNGRLMGEGNYLDRKKDSIWSYYSDLDGSLLSIETYVNGLLEGNVINYYPEGDVAEEIPYVKGVKEGSWKQFFLNGKIKLKASYINDRLEGVMQVYYVSGITHISGPYKNNFKHGPWMYFSEEGRAVRKETFRNGQLKETEEY